MATRLNDCLEKAANLGLPLFGQAEKNFPGRHGFQPLDEHRGRYQKVSAAAQEYFENYYVSSNDGRESTTIETKNGHLKISDDEAKILFHCTRRVDFSSPLMVVHGHAGTGKSTLLQYLFFYLYPNSEYLKKRFIPVYLTLDSWSSKIKQSGDNATQLSGTLDRYVRDLVASVLIEEVAVKIDEFLDWAKVNSRISYATFQELRNSYEGPSLLEEIFSPRRETHQDLLEGALKFVTQKVKPVVLILDNVDKLDIDAYELIFEYLDSRKEWGIKAIVTMRESSYEKIDRLIDQERDETHMISINYTKVCAILERWLDNWKEHTEFIGDSLSLRAKVSQLSKYLVLMLSDQKVIEFIVRTANLNLNVIARYMGWFVSAKYLQHENIIGNILSQRSSGGQRKVPLWLAMSTILVNRYGVTFKTDDENTRCGLKNLLCNVKCREYPYMHFFRANLLAYLYRQEKDSPGASIPIAELLRVFKDTYAPDVCSNIPKAMEMALFKLVESHLVLTESNRRYKKGSEMLEGKDSLFISESGKYYITNLIYKIEYLYFMKDDVPWLGKISFKMADQRQQRWERFYQVLLALEKLIGAECDMIELIKTNIQCSTDKGGERCQALIRYVSRMSLKAVFSLDDSMMFTRRMCDQYREHIFGVYRTRSKKVVEVFQRCEKTLDSFEKGYENFLSTG